MWPYDGRFEWFSDRLDGKTFTNPRTNESWQIVQKIRERCTYPLLPTDPEVLEAVAVFKCQLVSRSRATSPEVERILKVRMQIPTVNDTDELANDRSVYASAAVDTWSVAAKTEHDALFKLTAAGCKSTPRIDYFFSLKQDHSLWIPGGFLYAYLMELLPGIDLAKHWDVYRLPMAERDTIRKAFRRALEEVYKYKLDPMDTHLSNVLWDANSGRCFIIDMELYEDMEVDHGWTGYEYIFWHLEYPEETESRKKRHEELRSQLA